MEELGLGQNGLITTLFLSILGRHSRKPWLKYIDADNQQLVVPDVHG